MRKDRQLSVDYLAAAAGRPSIHTGRDIKQTHTGLGITEREWEFFVGHSQAMMNGFGVNAREQRLAVPSLSARASSARSGGSRRLGSPRAAIRRDGVFGPKSQEAAVAFQSGLHAQVRAAGRDPAGVNVLLALMVTLGDTESEARARARQLEEIASPEFRWQNALYPATLDPVAFDPEHPLPAEPWATESRPSSRAELLYAAARARPSASLREVAQQMTGGVGQMHFVRTAEQLAAQAIASQDPGACDGFTITGSTLPYELTAFVECVVPILSATADFEPNTRDARCASILGSSDRRRCRWV